MAIDVIKNKDKPFYLTVQRHPKGNRIVRMAFHRRQFGVNDLHPVLVNAYPTEQGQGLSLFYGGPQVSRKEKP